ncbi:de-hypoxanthine futalosine cyclase [Chthonomonas calidirosea]|uniref:Cyclic dehypoxanthine futalosine synthase n=2 Tax=Chthonomonas TaxID=1077265 RepID=S0EYU4_CHTCT|nr:cyclic dehypoxanthinyl futalosine synthase [Chthonomonas calidirosea]CCW35209.1 de-hypoxanthine futalosine cyclase [Chthonomonas calidirosea T49]CEK20773.1 de-hypoxanthine futalosine cyclase [Chthonomonas calidirosea]
MPTLQSIAPLSIEHIADKVYAGERLTAEEGLWLFHYPCLPELAHLANVVRERLHPATNHIVTYIVGRNINYTNVCWVRCKFCAFYRVPGHEEGYVLTKEQIFEKIQQMVDLGGIEILMQGGLNPKLKLEWYEDLLASIKARFGAYGVIIHAFSPAELIYIAKISKISLAELFQRLKAAGLDSVPGGGAEILTDRVREIIAPYKDTADEWINCMREAHKAGLRTTATMMYGSVETYEDRIEHLLRVRELQDETGGFTAFIPWSFQPEGTELPMERASAFDYLRTVAVSRLMLDNVPHMQASWVTQGPKIAQIALRYGLNDFGSTMMEENVVSAAGCVFTLPIEEIERLIRAAGYEPMRRTTQYQLLPLGVPEGSPLLANRA